MIDEEKQIETMRSVKHKKNEWYKELQNTIRKESLVPQLARHLTWRVKRELHASI